MDHRLALVLHPVRLRLIHALRTSGRLSVGELCERLPDLPQATVYRHVQQLKIGGVFEVESERKVRGVVERRYQLAEAAARVDLADARRMTLADHRQAFTAATAALIADFGAYLDRGDARPVKDCVSYRQFIVWLSPSERARLIEEMGKLMLRLMRNQSTAKREPYLLSTVFFPTGQAKQRKRAKRSRRPPA